MTSASDTRFYTLRISGMLDEDFLASFCPAGSSMTVHDNHVILANLYTDQSGIIGIIRQLHNFGCILLALDTTAGSSP
jgi:hypothetical protein